ncbi:MAG: hypothetical protein QNJ19_02790 [Woeseiaceae bacterium]|nr:hypothetical protein [Woeseiaceae bacterium]
MQNLVPRLLLVLVLPMLFAYEAVADEDGLIIQFKISEHAGGSDSRSSINSSVLMRLSEEVSFEIGGQYVLKIESKRDGEERVSLLVSLKDIVDGKPYYVGAGSAALKIGEKTQLSLRNYETNYTIDLDTSYGKLPDPGP